MMTMQTVYSAQTFGDFLSQPQTFVIDLRNATLIECVEKYVEVFSMIKPRTTHRRFTTVLSKLRALEFLYHITLKTEQVNDVFWIYFQNHLLENDKLNLSSVKTICSNLRSVLNWASRHNAIVSPTYDMFNIGEARSENIALTPDDISHIYYFDTNTVTVEVKKKIRVPVFGMKKVMTHKQIRKHSDVTGRVAVLVKVKWVYKRRRIGYKTITRKFKEKLRKDRIESLIRTRDALVLSCQLGCRHSDLIRICPENFDRNIFKIIQQKTGTYAKVDIDNLATHREITYSILEKYGYKFPFPYDNSKYNKNIHAILKMIGGKFTEDYVWEEKINDKIIEHRKPRYKMITTHSGRRSFITNNVLRGKKIMEIKKGSGHKSIRSFEGYYCDNEEL